MRVHCPNCGLEQPTNPRCMFCRTSMYVPGDHIFLKALHIQPIAEYDVSEIEDVRKSEEGRWYNRMKRWSEE